MIWLAIAFIAALVLTWSMCKVAREYDDMMEDCFMPTEMVIRARAQAVVDAWVGFGEG